MLDLDGSALEDGGWQVVAEIRSLTQLYASRSSLNDNSLINFKKLRKLEKVDVRDSSVTAEGAAAFKKVRPDVEVLR